MAKPRYWLVKSEPEVFSFEDLVKGPQRTTHWEGVRNYQARNLLRDSMKKGDRVFFYHSNTEEPGIQGITEVVREGYPDAEALNPSSPYFDEKAAKKGESPWVMIDVRATHRMSTPVTLSRMKAEAALTGMLLLKQGTRLSVQPVTEAEFNHICAMGKPQAL